MQQESKVCNLCNQAKPLSNFWKRKGTKDGLQYQCKECHTLKYSGHPYTGVQGKIKSIEYPDGTKLCCGCNVVKSLDNFYERRKKHKNGKLKRDTYCKQCWQDKNRKVFYNMSREEYDSLFTKQHGKCAICKEKLTGLKQVNIDYDHNTNLVRGILCSNCNFALGLLKDNIESLKSAIKYLEEAKKKELKLAKQN